MVATPGGQVAKLFPILATTTWDHNCCYQLAAQLALAITQVANRQRVTGTVNWWSGAHPDSRRNQEQVGSDDPGDLLPSLVQEPKKTKSPKTKKKVA